MNNSSWPGVVGVLGAMAIGAVMVQGWPDLGAKGWEAASAVGTVAAAFAAVCMPVWQSSRTREERRISELKQHLEAARKLADYVRRVSIFILEMANNPIDPGARPEVREGIGELKGEATGLRQGLPGERSARLLGEILPMLSEMERVASRKTAFTMSARRHRVKIRLAATALGEVARAVSAWEVDLLDDLSLTAH